MSSVAYSLGGVVSLPRRLLRSRIAKSLIPVRFRSGNPGPPAYDRLDALIVASTYCRSAATLSSQVASIGRNESVFVIFSSDITRSATPHNRSDPFFSLSIP